MGVFLFYTITKRGVVQEGVGCNGDGESGAGGGGGGGVWGGVGGGVEWGRLSQGTK